MLKILVMMMLLAVEPFDHMRTHTIDLKSSNAMLLVGVERL